MMTDTSILLGLLGGAISLHVSVLGFVVANMRAMHKIERKLDVHLAKWDGPH